MESFDVIVCGGGAAGVGAAVGAAQSGAQVAFWNAMASWVELQPIRRSFLTVASINAILEENVQSGVLVTRCHWNWQSWGKIYNHAAPS